MKGHALCDAPFAGLLVRGPVNDQGVVSSYAQLNASMHSVAELEKATHINELREWDEGMYVAALTTRRSREREVSHSCLVWTVESIHVHWDHKHMGVGGDNTWEPDVVHPEYIVNATGSFDFELCMCPLMPGQTPQSEAAIARQ